MNSVSKSVHIKSILDLENEVLKLPQVELPLKHDFIDGVYARSMFIPAGTVLTGAVHAKDCFTVIRYGDLIIYTEEGAQTVKAGEMLLSTAGIKRAGYAITDTYITGFMANPSNETDLDKLWKFYTLPNESLLSSVSKELLEEN
ncbi:MAG: hypothetical protein WC762_03165 [Methylobacter sp.]|jgi:hypothetical protein